MPYKIFELNSKGSLKEAQDPYDPLFNTSEGYETFKLAKEAARARQYCYPDYYILYVHNREI